MESFHDNEIIRYEVNLREREVIIYTQIRKDSNTIRFKIVFSNVIAHLFENELPGSIILELRKDSLGDFIRENKEILNSMREFLWPVDYDTFEELQEILLDAGYRYYSIISSYGLCGWILAKTVQVYENNSRTN